MKSLCFLLLAAGVVACTTPKALITGNYVETRGPGVILWESIELQINPNNTFVYVHSSDDIASGKYGEGTYKFTDKKLRLTFANLVPATPQMQSHPLIAHPDSVTFTFLVKSGNSRNPELGAALPEATIIALDVVGRVITGTSSDKAGFGTLRLARASHPQKLIISSVGLLTWEQACPASSTAYQVQLPENLGTPYAAGTVKEFRVLRQAGGQLVLKQGANKIRLISQRAKP
jgi:hypothetical protein